MKQSSLYDTAVAQHDEVSGAPPELCLAGDYLEINEAEKPNRVLFSNIAWMLVGNVTYGFSQWALLVALAKIGTIEMVGSFALAMAIGVPVLMFSSLSLRALQVTDYKHSYRFLEYVALRLFTICLSLVVIVVFGLVAGYSTAILVSTVLIGAAKSVEYISDILYGMLQQKENMSGIAVSMILRGTLSIATLVVMVRLTHSLAWGAAGLLVSSALVLLAYDIPKGLAVAKFRHGIVLNECISYVCGLVRDGGHRRLCKLAMTGLPMGFVMLMVSLNLNIPRYYIQQHLGMRELGIFSAIATLLAAGSVVANAVGQAAAPRLARCFAIGDKGGFGVLLSSLVIASLGLGALGFTGALLFGREAMALIYRPEYSARQDVLLWLMGASGFFYLGSTLGYAVTAARCFTPQLPLFAAAALTTAIGCMFLVPSQGLRGAAIAILISAVIQCAGSAGLLYSSCRKSTGEPAPSY